MLRRMLAEVFNEDEVAVFGEEITDPARFTTLPFNHIVFTGSPTIGKVVMRAAAENLTPVTLELGGKSPAIVSRNYPLADAAKRITHGKATNSGQICVAPDYALVPKESIDEFVEAAKSSFIKMFGHDIENNENYTSIVNDRHLKRIQDILTDAQEKVPLLFLAILIALTNKVAGCLAHCAELHAKYAHYERRTLWPILPVVAYDSLDDAITM